MAKHIDEIYLILYHSMWIIHIVRLSFCLMSNHIHIVIVIMNIPNLLIIYREN